MVAAPPKKRSPTSTLDRTPFVVRDSGAPRPSGTSVTTEESGTVPSRAIDSRVAALLADRLAPCNVTASSGAGDVRQVQPNTRSGDRMMGSR